MQQDDVPVVVRPAPCNVDIRGRHANGALGMSRVVNKPFHGASHRVDSSRPKPGGRLALPLRLADNRQAITPLYFRPSDAQPTQQAGLSNTNSQCSRVAVISHSPSLNYLIDTRDVDSIALGPLGRFRHLSAGCLFLSTPMLAFLQRILQFRKHKLKICGHVGSDERRQDSGIAAQSECWPIGLSRSCRDLYGQGLPMLRPRLPRTHR